MDYLHHRINLVFEMLKCVKIYIQNKKDKQLFSYDICSIGAKNFIFSTYENIYEIIKSSKTTI